MAASDRPDSKVARLIDRYGLDGLGDELERRWTADGQARLSLRDCAELFNKRVLEAVLVEAELNALRRDVETTYEQLTDEEVTAGVRTETRNRLAREGVDTRGVIEPNDLGLGPATPLGTEPAGGWVTLREMETRYIARVLESVGGNKVRAAAILGIDPSTLYRRRRRS